jgi:hypothetical protein
MIADGEGNAKLQLKGAPVFAPSLRWTSPRLAGTLPMRLSEVFPQSQDVTVEYERIRDTVFH